MKFGEMMKFTVLPSGDSTLGSVSIQKSLMSSGWYLVIDYDKYIFIPVEDDYEIVGGDGRIEVRDGDRSVTSIHYHRKELEEKWNIGSSATLKVNAQKLFELIVSGKFNEILVLNEVGKELLWHFKIEGKSIIIDNPNFKTEIKIDDYKKLTLSSPDKKRDGYDLKLEGTMSLRLPYRDFYALVCLKKVKSKSRRDSESSDD